jgi:hypothetical protein
MVKKNSDSIKRFVYISSAVAVISFDEHEKDNARYSKFDGDTVVVDTDQLIKVIPLGMQKPRRKE